MFARILAVTIVAQSYVAADLSKAGLGFMLDGKSAFDGNTFDAEGTFVPRAGPSGSARFRRAEGDADRLCDIEIVEKDTSTEIKAWLQMIYRTQYGGDGKEITWPDSQYAEPRNVYLASKSVAFSNGEGKKPVTYYLNHYNLWVVGPDKCAVTNSQSGCPIYAYWLNSGGAKYPQELLPLRFWNQQAGQWQTDNQAKTQCACPVGEYRDDMDDVDCKKLTVCKPGQKIKVKHHIFQNRVCEDCKDDEYSPKDNSEQCLPRGVCKPGLYAKKVATKANANQCVACPNGLFTSQINQPKCQEWKRCPLGYEQDADGTATSDRTCKTCKNGVQFKDRIGQSECENCGTCSAGQYIAQQCSVVADIVCKQCPQCPNGEYLEGTCDPTSDQAPVCKPCHEKCSTCGGKTELQCLTCPGTNHLETKDHKTITQDGEHLGECVSECDAGKYEAVDSGHIANDQDRVCKKCDTTCGHDCVGPSNQECLSCPPSRDTKFHILRRNPDNKQKGLGGECVAPTSCKAETYADYKNLECEPCMVCVEGVSFENTYNQNDRCSSENNRKCTPVRQSCDREVHKFESKAPTLTGDRKCSECYDCPAGTRTDSELGTACATSKRDCKACDGEKEYQDRALQLQCLQQTECDEGTDYQGPEGQEPTPSQQAVCRYCSEEEYDHDRDPYTDCEEKTKCKPFDSAQLGDAEYEFDAGSEIKNRICKDVTFCKQDTEFEYTAPTLSTDRACEKYTKCNFWDIKASRGTEYEAFSGDKTQDVTCEFLSICGQGDNKKWTIEVLPPTKLTDRECSDDATKFKNGTVVMHHQTDVKADQVEAADKDRQLPSGSGVAQGCKYTVYPVTEQPADWQRRTDGTEFTAPCNDKLLSACLKLKKPIVRLAGRQVITDVCHTETTTTTTTNVDAMFSKYADKSNTKYQLSLLTAKKLRVKEAELLAEYKECKNLFSSGECQNQQNAVAAASAVLDEKEPKDEGGDMTIIIVIVAAVLIIFLALGAIVFVRSKTQASGPSYSANTRTGGFHENPVYAQGGKANPVFGNQAPNEGMYAETGGNEHGYMDVSPNQY